jgi:hypothetical protein
MVPRRLVDDCELADITRMQNARMASRLSGVVIEILIPPL